MRPLQSAELSAIATGAVAAAADFLLPPTRGREVTVAMLSAASISVAWITVDKERSYTETSESLYAALAIAAVVSGLTSYAVSRRGGLAKWGRAAVVGGATAVALLLSRHERDSGLNAQWSRFQYFKRPGSCPKGQVWCNGECCSQCSSEFGCLDAKQSGSCPKGQVWCDGECCSQCSSEFGCLDSKIEQTTPYLGLPTGGWNPDDLTDSKRPRGWMMDKFCNAREYVNCPGCAPV